jgi:hypothetical protein
LATSTISVSISFVTLKMVLISRFNCSDSSKAQNYFSLCLRYWKNAAHHSMKMHSSDVRTLFLFFVKLCQSQQRLPFSLLPNEIGIRYLFWLVTSSASAVSLFFKNNWNSMQDQSWESCYQCHYYIIANTSVVGLLILGLCLTQLSISP